MKTLRLFFTVITISLFFSCSEFEELNDEKIDTPEEPNDTTLVVPDKVSLHYSDDGGRSFTGEYEGVRIGEYYWMNSNFYHIKGHEVKRSDIEKIFNIYGLKHTDFNVTMDDFNRYFGSYYSRPAMEDIVNYGRMYEGDDLELMLEWDLPHAADFRQLFGMCGNGKVEAVMRFLACKAGDLPVAIYIEGSAWVGGFNKNIYGFNLLPTGAIFNGDGYWDPYVTGVGFPVTRGDMYALYQAVLFPAHDSKTVGVHDFVSTSGGKLWHYLPMRWCRKLSDEELGYKLYIDKDKTDIVKLELSDDSPDGYVELEKGYLRGFYVQYILDQKKPEKTIAQIVEMAKDLI